MGYQTRFKFEYNIWVTGELVDSTPLKTHTSYSFKWPNSPECYWGYILHLFVVVVFQSIVWCTSNCRFSPHHVMDDQHLLEQTEVSHISFIYCKLFMIYSWIFSLLYNNSNFANFCCLFSLDKIFFSISSLTDSIFLIAPTCISLSWKRRCL